MKSRVLPLGKKPTRIGHSNSNYTSSAMDYYTLPYTHCFHLAFASGFLRYGTWSRVVWKAYMDLIYHGWPTSFGYAWRDGRCIGA